MDPDGEARAKMVGPSCETHPATMETGWAAECWPNRAAMLEPWRESGWAEANMDACSPPEVEERDVF